MGGRLTRVFRTFNVESRARREISKEKPTPAPRHPTSRLDELTDRPEIQQEIYRKDNRLLTLLKDVYVESRDPPAQVSASLSVGGICASALLFSNPIGTDCDHATYMLRVLHFNMAVIFFCSSPKFLFLLPQMQKGSWPTPLKDTVCQRCPIWLLEEKKLGLMLRHGCGR
uniref:NADH dehydrogenase [ubiquinone] 1 alpha subcomplex assembly factor 4 n=1 Tax=Pavo cristatus TaxID=9049 RepID=A0A8C9F3M1_PAVCR